MGAEIGWTILVVYAVYFIIAAFYIFSPPTSTPSAFLRQKEISCPGRKRLVLIGDSITHGHASANYAAMIVRRLKNAGKLMDVINAGINSHLAWNVVQDIDDIIACNPDFITILIGTNDAHSTLDPLNEWSYKKQWKLPQTPDASWYKNNLSEILSTLKDLTKARIAVLSLPTIGENPSDPAFKVGQQYSIMAKEIASKAGVTYLPLCEIMSSEIKKKPSNIVYKAKKQVMMQIGQLFIHYHGIPWSWISKLFGFQFHVDFLHLNKAGATMIADCIEKFILGDAPSRKIKPKKIRKKGFWTPRLPANIGLCATTMLVPKHIDQEGLKMGFMMGMISIDQFKALCHLDEAMTLSTFVKKIGWDEDKAIENIMHLLGQDLIGIA